jgi:hypothetical protein
VKVRIHVEGGPIGVDANGLRRFRVGFKQHFERLDPQLRSLDVISRGSTDQTIKAYSEGVRQYAGNSIVALLVDSDSPVTTGSAAKHLETKLDSASVPQGARANIFLMVQCMEAWFVTDIIALEKCFGTKVHSIEFPRNPNVEAVLKKDLLAALDLPAKHTPTRRYHKIRDGAKYSPS